jgi:hypothetical protein
LSKKFQMIWGDLSRTTWLKQSRTRLINPKPTSRGFQADSWPISDHREGQKTTQS